MLEKTDLISPDLSQRMQAMVGFRNIAVHDYIKLSLVILRSILNERLQDIQIFASELIKFSNKP